MKIGEQFIDGDGDTFHVKQTFDPNPALQEMDRIRAAGVGHTGDNKHIGRVPGWMIAEWLKEAGVKWNDIAVRDEVVKKKMMSGDVAAFRNWQGTY